MHSAKPDDPAKTYDYIPLFEGRPERDYAISKDEVLNFMIDLELLSPKDLFDKYFR